LKLVPLFEGPLICAHPCAVRTGLVLAHSGALKSPHFPPFFVRAQAACGINASTLGSDKLSIKNLMRVFKGQSDLPLEKNPKTTEKNSHEAFFPELFIRSRNSSRVNQVSNDTIF